jgi:hypothetical protein
MGGNIYKIESQLGKLDEHLKAQFILRLSREKC